MPIEIAPNDIELDGLDGGYAPSMPESAVPMNASPDMLNLLLDQGSRAPEVRKGFQRVTNGKSSLTAHHVKNLYYYETWDANTRKRYLMAIMADGSTNANNTQVWAYDLINDTFTRVDTVGRTWTNSRSPHWSAVVGGIYFGGVRGDVIYSWHPTDGWNANPTNPATPKRWVDATNDAVNTTNQIARDFAFKKGQKVLFDAGNGDEIFSALRDIRFDRWEDGHEYKVGDLVTRNHIWQTTSRYRKSFECIRSHKSDTTKNAPGTSAASSAYWKKVRLPPIIDPDDDETPKGITKAWTPSQNGVKSSVGVFYGDRMMVRRDNENDKSKLQYSAPLTLEKDKRMPDVKWDPTDWAAEDTINGEGGGWLPVFSGQGDAIRGVYDMGNYLVISKRWRTYVLNGRSEQTWALRKLGDQGVVSINNIAECDGLVYGLSHNGTLWVTDGTSLREVPGYEKAREFIKERIDRLMQFGASADDDDEHYMPSIFEYDHRIWIALPDHSAASPADDITMVYDPTTEGGSWWKLNLPILSAATGAENRAKRLWIAPPNRTGNATIFYYTDDPGQEGFVDDDSQGAGSSPASNAIAWRWRTGWFQWGLAHKERRVRRTWALVKTAVSVTIKGYRNFITTPVYTQTRSAGAGGSTHVEGKTLGRAVSAAAIEVSGTAATGGPALIGVGMQTEPIRTRFHRN